LGSFHQCREAICFEYFTSEGEASSVDSAVSGSRVRMKERTDKGNEQSREVEGQGRLGVEERQS